MSFSLRKQCSCRYNQPQSVPYEYEATVQAKDILKDVHSKAAGTPGEFPVYNKNTPF